jgi:phage shock protein A
MGVFDRIGTLLKSNLNDLISRAEDPEKMLEQAIVDLKQQLVESKSRVALAIADEKRLEKERDRQAGLVEEWERRAMQAVRAERDDLAVQALEKQKEESRITGQLELQLEEQQRAVAALKGALTGLSNRIQEVTRERDALLARKRRAEAQKSVAAHLAAAQDPKALAPMARVNERVDRLEAEAQAQFEVATMSGALGDPLEAEFKKLGPGPAAPESDDLLALKRKMGLIGAPAPPRALPEGGTEPAVDDPDA